jgi:hypothetical protein
MNLIKLKHPLGLPFDDAADMSDPANSAMVTAYGGSEYWMPLTDFTRGYIALKRLADSSTSETVKQVTLKHPSGPPFDGSADTFDPANNAMATAHSGNTDWTALADFSGGNNAAKDSTKTSNIGTVSQVTASGATVVSIASSPFHVNITWDASVGSAPSGFTNAVIAAVQALESQINTAVTININVGYGEVAGSAMTSLGSCRYYLTSVSYSQLVSALEAHSTSAADTSVLASLPAASPVSGTYWITNAQAKALGLASATGAGTDGFIGLSSAYSVTYDNTAGIAGGTYDFAGVVQHEVTQVMGRMMLTGSTIGSTPSSYSLLDLMHYSAAGVQVFSNSTPGYFSIDGGTTNLAAFNTAAGGDPGDWASSVVADSFDAFSVSGIINAVTPTDLIEMDAIGWSLNGSAPPVPPPSTGVPTGISLSAVTMSLGAAQSAGGLTAGVALAKISQTGGPGSDSYSYALGGTAAASFALATANNVATLSTVASGVAGSVAGSLYSISVTATDTSSGNAASPVAVNVVVGDSANDTIMLAALPGIAASAPAFIYGLAGNDTIKASGMSGKLYIDGGAGADTMTGGSGINVYMYGAASDSSGTGMDIITNFHVANDLIDLTGLGASLRYKGEISTKTKSLAAGSIAWQVSNGNTYVYVNTSESAQAFGAANIKIDLQGSLSLSSKDFLYA